MKIVLNLDAFWVRFWSILGSQTPSKKSGGSSPLFDLEIVRCSCYVTHRFKRPQGAPKRPQGAPQSALRGPKRLPKAPQETPRGPQETSRAVPEGSKPAQELPRASQDAHTAFPKHLAWQPFSENSRHAHHGSKKHRRSLRSPISMNPKGLASSRRRKKSGRAAVLPLGEVNPPPATEGRSRAC